MHFPTDRTEHTTAFDGPVVDHLLKPKIAQTANTSTMQDRSDDQNLHGLVPYRLVYVPLPIQSLQAGWTNAKQLIIN